MDTKKIIRAALFLGILVSGIVISVSAYSADAIGLFEQGNAFMKNKTYAEALRVYDKAISIEPEYFEAWNGKADALNRVQQFDAALKASDRVLIIKSDYVPGWINRGYILYNLGRYDEELKAYETAVTLDPANPEAWFNIGYSLAGMKRYDEAIAAFNKVETLDPTYPNLAGNKQIAEQYRNATFSGNTSKKTSLTPQRQLQITTSPTVKTGIVTPAMPSTKSEPTQSPVSVGGVIGFLSMLFIARKMGKREKW